MVPSFHCHGHDEGHDPAESHQCIFRHGWVCVTPINIDCGKGLEYFPQFFEAERFKDLKTSKYRVTCFNDHHHDMTIFMIFGIHKQNWYIHTYIHTYMYMYITRKIHKINKHILPECLRIRTVDVQVLSLSLDVLLCYTYINHVHDIHVFSIMHMSASKCRNSCTC